MLTDQFLKTLAAHVLKLRSHKPVVNMDGAYNILLVKDAGLLPPQYKQYPVRKHTIRLQYKDYALNEVLTQLLPASFASQNLIPSSFETIGHIAHLNLQAAHTPFKKLIGQVLSVKPRLSSTRTRS